MKKKTRRRTKRSSEPALGNVTFHIIDQEGVELRPPQGNLGVATVRAQEIVMRNYADGDEATVYIERRALFGPPAEIGHVVREEDGTVKTYITNRED